MTESLQCPRCSGTQVSQQLRHRNPKNGNSVGRWFSGCLLWLVILSALVAAGGVFVRVHWPTNLFSEAALLTAAIAAIYTIGVGIFALWVRRWPLVNDLTCGSCGYKWYVDIPPRQDEVHALDAGKSGG